MSRRKILITGGLGYLGGRIAQALVVNPENRITLTSRVVAELGLDWCPGVEIRQLDLGASTIPNSLFEGSIDTVIHLAAMNEVDAVANPQMANKINGEGAANLLEAAINGGVRRFVNFSTAHVYGRNLRGKVTEDTQPLPEHPYAVSHRIFEEVLENSHLSKRIEGISLRLSNGFGAPSHRNITRWKLLVNDLCRQAVEARSLTLKSSGSQFRNFIPIANIVEGVEHILSLRDVSDGLYNLGSKRLMSIRAMAELIVERCQEVLGYSPKLIAPEEEEPEAAQPMDFDFSIDKITSTGLSLSDKFNDEIDRTLIFCRDTFRPD